jgi:hypothetical protein
MRHIMGIMVAMGMPMPDGIIEGIGMAMGIWAAGFMVTSWLDNERYGEYNRSLGRRDPPVWHGALDLSAKNGMR